MAFSPTALRLAFIGGQDRISIQDVNSPDGPCIMRMPENVIRVTCCQWSLDGTKLAAATRHGYICIWQDVRESCDPLVLDPHNEYDEDGEQVTFLAFSSDNHILVTAYDLTYPYQSSRTSVHVHWRIWEVSSGRLLHKMGPPLEYLPRQTVFHPQCQRIAASCTDSAVRMWDARTGELVAVYQRHDSVVSVLFHPDGRRVLFSTRGGPGAKLHLWDYLSGRLSSIPESHPFMIRATAFSPNGELIASASADGRVQVWKERDGSCVATFHEHRACVMFVAFSPAGDVLASGGDDGCVYVRHLHL